jgi:hypothetical protein
MLDANQVTIFLGWCIVINMVVYAFSALFITVFKDFTMRIHSQLIGLDASKLPALYFKFMGSFKIFIIVFNLTPYIALKLMG